MSRENLRLVVAIARTYNNLFGAIERDLSRYDMNLSEFGVMECLLHKGDQPVQKLAEKILVTSGTITYVIDKLQKKGYITRRKCEKDKRVYYISLTHEGEVAIQEVFNAHEQFLETLFHRLSREEKETLVSKLVYAQLAMDAEKMEVLK